MIDEGGCHKRDLLEERCELFVPDRLQGVSGLARLTELNAFIHTLQMRRSIQACAVAGAGKNAGKHGCGRAFSIRARNEHGRKAALRRAKSGGERPHVIELKFTFWRTWGEYELPSELRELLDGLGIQHSPIVGEAGVLRVWRIAGVVTRCYLRGIAVPRR